MQQAMWIELHSDGCYEGNKAGQSKDEATLRLIVHGSLSDDDICAELL